MSGMGKAKIIISVLMLSAAYANHQGTVGTHSPLIVLFQLYRIGSQAKIPTNEVEMKVPMTTNIIPHINTRKRIP